MILASIGFPSAPVTLITTLSSPGVWPINKSKSSNPSKITTLNNGVLPLFLTITSNETWSKPSTSVTLNFLVISAVGSTIVTFALDLPIVSSFKNNSTLLTFTAPSLLDGSNIVGLAVKLIDKTPFAKLLEWTLLTVIVIS